MKKAMTIGELLITMAVIGIIAILVLPGFLQDYHKKVYVNRLKKTLEMVENAVNQACTDNDVSYFIQTKYATMDDGASQQEFVNKYFKLASGDNGYPFASAYKVINTGESKAAGLNNGHGYAKLADGQALSFYCGAHPDEISFCTVRIDVNANDGPNIAGRDFFVLYLDRATNKIYDNNSASVCGTNQYGSGCFQRLIEDNWEMKY